MPAAERTVTVSTRLPERVAQGFEALAQLDGYTSSGLLRRLVLVHIMTGQRPPNENERATAAMQDALEPGSDRQPMPTST